MTTRTSRPRRWTADNQVELVFLPTYGSSLNWIESEFDSGTTPGPGGFSGQLLREDDERVGVGLVRAEGSVMSERVVGGDDGQLDVPCRP